MAEANYDARPWQSIRGEGRESGGERGRGAGEGRKEGEGGGKKKKSDDEWGAAM